MNKEDKIVVLDYDPNWAIEFERLKTVFAAHLEGDFISIEHVGSTSIVGLAAKPVIDMDIVIPKQEDHLQVIIEKLRQLGYEHKGDLGITGREVFKPIRLNAPFDDTHPPQFVHHLYVCPEGSMGLRNHLAIRNYLLANPSAVKAYGQLKKELAAKHGSDRMAYMTAKTDFLVNILHKQGFDPKETDQIDQENKN